MRYGDIEGKGMVYGADGKLITAPDECVTARTDGYCRKLEKRVRLHWRIVFFDGEGLFQFTQHRLVFLRVPQAYDSPAQFETARFATLADHEYWANRSTLALARGALEFVELPYAELVRVKRGRKRAQFDAEDEDGTKYRWIVDAAVANLLEQLIEGGTGAYSGPQVCIEDDERVDDAEDGSDDEDGALDG